MLETYVHIIGLALAVIGISIAIAIAYYKQDKNRGK